MRSFAIAVCLAASLFSLTAGADSCWSPSRSIYDYMSCKSHSLGEMAKQGQESAFDFFRGLKFWSSTPVDSRGNEPNHRIKRTHISAELPEGFEPANQDALFSQQDVLDLASELGGEFVRFNSVFFGFTAKDRFGDPAGGIWVNSSMLCQNGRHYRHKDYYDSDLAARVLWEPLTLDQMNPDHRDFEPKSSIAYLSITEYYWSHIMCLEENCRAEVHDGAEDFAIYKSLEAFDRGESPLAKGQFHIPFCDSLTR